MIAVKNLRIAFEKSRLTKCEVARRLGWFKPPGRGRKALNPDIGRVSVVMGLAKGGKAKHQGHVTYDTAVRFCRAINASPFDLGV